ncbi:hypothetical protein WN943_019631 [Citrus x changshan-huyou]
MILIFLFWLVNPILLLAIGAENVEKDCYPVLLVVYNLGEILMGIPWEGNGRGSMVIDSLGLIKDQS